MLGLVIGQRRVEVENSGSRRDSSGLVSDARHLPPGAAASRCYESLSPYEDRALAQKNRVVRLIIVP